MGPSLTPMVFRSLNPVARIALTLFTSIALGATGACGGGQAGRPDMAQQEQAAAQQAKAEQDIVKRGEYLVAIGGCNDCHTPMRMGPTGPEPDMARLLSGHPQDLKMPPAPPLSEPWMYAGAATNTAFSGPWGVSYAINLTPDDDTGIGLWTEQVFVNALKTGRHMGVGRPIMPPMPWQGYSRMTDDDLRALFAYLHSLEAKKNLVPDAVVNEPPPPATPPAQ